MGIISPSAALCAQVVIAGVQQDLPVYRRRDVETTAKDWTMKLPEEQRHSRAEAVVNLQPQHVGISQECWDLARIAEAELDQTIESHLWLANLEISSGMAPGNDHYFNKCLGIHILMVQLL